MFYNVAGNYSYAVNLDKAAAMQLCQSGLSLAISIGSVNRQSKALHQIACIKAESGDFSGAKENSSEVQRMAKITGNLYMEARAINVEAVCWQHLGGYNHCISLLDRAADLLDLCDMSGGTLHTGIRTTQAEVHRCKSEYVVAHKIQNHILQDSSGDQNSYKHDLALLNIAQIDVEMSASEHDVQRNLDTAVMLFQGRKHSTGLILCDAIKAALDLQQGNMLAARNLFQKCLRSAWGRHTEAVTYCLEKLGAVQQWGPVDRVSFSGVVTFLAHSVKHKQKLELHKALQFLGDVFQAQGDQETAISLFTVALDGFTQMDVHRSRAECMVRLGDILNLNGDPLEAVKLWETATPPFERLSQGKQLVDLNSSLPALATTSYKSLSLKLWNVFPKYMHQLSISNSCPVQRVLLVASRGLNSLRI
jgi:tetratricopeptide (TPR) repeat protein